MHCGRSVCVKSWRWKSACPNLKWWSPAEPEGQTLDSSLHWSSDADLRSWYRPRTWDKEKKSGFLQRLVVSSIEAGWESNCCFFTLKVSAELFQAQSLSEVSEHFPASFSHYMGILAKLTKWHLHLFHHTRAATIYQVIDQDKTNHTLFLINHLSFQSFFKRIAVLASLMWRFAAFLSHLWS